MTEYALAFCEEDYEQLRQHLSSDGRAEQGAYLICRQSITDAETTLLVRDVIPVTAEDVIEADAEHMVIRSRSFHARDEARPEPQQWNGLPVNTSAGLEAGLIRLIRPEWNMLGAKK